MTEEKKDIDPNESGSAHVTHMSDIPQVNSDAEGPRTVEQYSRREDKVGGVRLQVLNILMIVAFGILSLYLLFGTFRTNEGYTEMRTATDKYIVCQQAASDMQAASDFLTDQVRTFAVTGDREAVARYFEEVNVTKRRDNALSSMHEYLSDSDAESHLADALKAAPADTLNVCLNTGSSPCILTAADGGDSFTYMILPVRLRAGQ